MLPLLNRFVWHSCRELSSNERHRLPRAATKWHQDVGLLKRFHTGVLPKHWQPPLWFGRASADRFQVLSAWLKGEGDGGRSNEVSKIAEGSPAKSTMRRAGALVLCKLQMKESSLKRLSVQIWNQSIGQISVLLVWVLAKALGHTTGKYYVKKQSNQSTTAVSAG